MYMHTSWCIQTHYAEMLSDGHLGGLHSKFGLQEVREITMGVGIALEMLTFGLHEGAARLKVLSWHSKCTS